MFGRHQEHRHGRMLAASKMNVNPGGKQSVMGDGWWNSKLQKINYSIGVPKGMKVILQERGIETSNMNGDKM